MTFWARLASSSCFLLKRRLSLSSSSCLVASSLRINNHDRFRGGGGSGGSYWQQQQQTCHLFSSKRETKTSRRSLLPPDKRNLLQIAILGPPNAGKSTLFNRFLDKESNKSYRLKSEKTTRKRRRYWQNYEGGNAIVSNVPGTTRDCRQGIGRIGTCYFWMMDTAGVNGERLEQHVAVTVADKKSTNSSNNIHNNNRKVVHHDEYSNTSRANNNNSAGQQVADDGERRRMVHVMIQQALLAARQADIIFVMFDARQTGVTSDILEICRWLRKEERGSNYGSRSGRSGKVILLANKLENEHHWDYKKDSPIHAHLAEAARTGFDVLSISAQHGDGMADIANVIEELYLERQQHQQQQQQQDGADDDDDTVVSRQQGDQDKGDDNDDDDEEKPLQLAILGRPNVGKSTLVNALLRRERVLTGPTPGVTRDAISIEWSWEGRPVQLVDTAGMIRLHSNYKGGQSSSSSSSGSKSIKKVRIPASSSSSLTSTSSLNNEFAGDGDDKRHEMQNIQIQDMAVKDALRAMKMTDVAVLVLDAGAKRLHRRELALAKAVLDEGRALVIAANKMDLVLQKAHYRDHHDAEEEVDDDDDGSYTKADFARDVRDQLESRFPMLRQTPIVPMSSLTGEGVEDLMPVVFRARDRWARTISTGELNRWLEDVVMVHQQSSVTHETNKIKYIMQTKGRPPTFLLFLNGSSSTISDSSLRFLTRQLQDSFQMYGMNVRLIAKNSSQRDFRPKRKRGGSGLGGHEARKKRTIKLLQTTGSPKKQRRKAKRR